MKKINSYLFALTVFTCANYSNAHAEFTLHGNSSGYEYIVGDLIGTEFGHQKYPVTVMTHFDDGLQKMSGFLYYYPPQKEFKISIFGHMSKGEYYLGSAMEGRINNEGKIIGNETYPDIDSDPTTGDFYIEELSLK